MEEIEKVQYKAALAVIGAWRGSNCSKLYEELGWESLSDRRMSRRVLMVHKIVNNRTPLYLRSNLPLVNRGPGEDPLIRYEATNTTIILMTLLQMSVFVTTVLRTPTIFFLNVLCMIRIEQPLPQR